MELIQLQLQIESNHQIIIVFVQKKVTAANLFLW